MVDKTHIFISSIDKETNNSVLTGVTGLGHFLITFANYLFRNTFFFLPKKRQELWTYNACNLNLKLLKSKEKRKINRVQNRVLFFSYKAKYDLHSVSCFLFKRQKQKKRKNRVTSASTGISREFRIFYIICNWNIPSPNKAKDFITENDKPAHGLSAPVLVLWSSWVLTKILRIIQRFY